MRTDRAVFSPTSRFAPGQSLTLFGRCFDDCHALLLLLLYGFVLHPVLQVLEFPILRGQNTSWELHQQEAGVTSEALRARAAILRRDGVAPAQFSVLAAYKANHRVVRIRLAKRKLGWPIEVNATENGPVNRAFRSPLTFRHPGIARYHCLYSSLQYFERNLCRGNAKIIRLQPSPTGTPMRQNPAVRIARP